MSRCYGHFRFRNFGIIIALLIINTYFCLRDQQYIKKIQITEVRHLRDVTIDICDTEMKHLILTGKNGSGKSSVLKLLQIFLDTLSNFFKTHKGNIKLIQNPLIINQSSPSTKWNGKFSYNLSKDLSKFQNLLSFNFETNRGLKVEKSQGFRDQISNKGIDFEKFLAKKRFEQAYLSFDSGRKKEVDIISAWFNHLEKSLQYLFEDETLRLISKLDTDKINFFLTSDYRNEVDFNTLSSGYGSILSILFDMMQEIHSADGSFDYAMPGIALIDEVETHLHVSLQKKILPFLTSFFPNIQFIVSTHSPYILQSLKNAVIFDLETKKRFEDFSNYSSETILEAFYDMDKFSEVLKAEMKAYEAMLSSVNGKNKKEIITMRSKFLDIVDIEANFWIKDMDLKYRDKIKSLLS